MCANGVIAVIKRTNNEAMYEVEINVETETACLHKPRIQAAPESDLQSAHLPEQARSARRSLKGVPTRGDMNP